MNPEFIYNSTILAIDDEPANLKLIDRILRNRGYRHVITECDPSQALARYHELQPDLILLDLNMPGLSGYDVIEALKALEDPLLPPIVILTAQQGRDNLVQALSAGARDFIAKPFDRSELLMRVRNLLEAHLAHSLMHQQKQVLETMVRSRTEELRRTRLQVVQRLGMAAEHRDEETGGHILRMSHVCALLAKGIGWGDAQCELVLHASPMHDVGKIGIPDAILLKPGSFEPDEWQVMKTHTEIGRKLLDGDDSDLMCMAREIAYTHHEKWDGSGYPRGLAGTEIPLSGRIAAVSDVFDALTSERPYKRAWPVKKALKLLRENRGRHFDPELIDVFFDHLPDILDIQAHYADYSHSTPARSRGWSKLGF